MVFGTGCEPDVDWSLCEDATGFPSVLPAFYMISAILHGATAALYTVSIAQTLRLQLKENNKIKYNTAIQMHVGIVTYSVAALTQGLSLVSRQPGLPALPLLLLIHLRYISVGYVTTVLVRHWAVLYQQMKLNQKNQGSLDGRIERFVELYRDGEVLQAVIACAFFFGSVIYGVRNQENWDSVDRLADLVWAILSGITCWLVTILGQRVHANMKSVARSRTVLDYLRRVKYVVIGSSLLWCQRAVCFSFAAWERPAAGMWLFLQSGKAFTGVGVGWLYYIVIGAKIANKAAHAVETARAPTQGVRRVKGRLKLMAGLVSTGANHIKDGVSTIVAMGEAAGAGVRMNSGGAAGRRWSALLRRWSVQPRIYAIGSDAQSGSMTGSGAGTMTWKGTRVGTGTRSARPGTATKSGQGPGPGPGPGPEPEPERGRRPRNGGEDRRKRPDANEELVCRLDEEVDSHDSVLDRLRGKSIGDGGADKRAAVEEKHEEVETMSESTLSNRLSESGSFGRCEDDDAHSGREDTCEDDDAHSGEEDTEAQHQKEAKPVRRKLSSWSRAQRLSSDEHSASSGGESNENAGDDFKEEEETWRVEDLETNSLDSSGHDSSSGRPSRQRTGSSPSDHSSRDGTHYSEEHRSETEVSETFLSESSSRRGVRSGERRSRSRSF